MTIQDSENLRASYVTVTWKWRFEMNPLSPQVSWSLAVQRNVELFQTNVLTILSKWQWRQILGIYRLSQDEGSIFWEVIVSVILSKNIYMNMYTIPNGFRYRVIWLYNRKTVDKKDILRVRAVSNTDIYCSSDRVGTVYNKCSKIPPSISMHFATRVKKTWRVVRLSASWRSFMQAITSSMLTSGSSRVSTFFSVHFTLHEIP